MHRPLMSPPPLWHNFVLQAILMTQTIWVSLRRPCHSHHRPCLHNHWPVRLDGYSVLWYTIWLIHNRICLIFQPTLVDWNQPSTKPRRVVMHILAASLPSTPTHPNGLDWKRPEIAAKLDWPIPSIDVDFRPIFAQAPLPANAHGAEQDHTTHLRPYIRYYLLRQ